jgi:hypothetical protein
MNTIAIIATLLALSSVASADEKVIKPVSCLNFTEATTTDGAKVGICAPATARGKARFLRTYQIVSVVDPTTDKPVKLMVGFQ